MKTQLFKSFRSVVLFSLLTVTLCFGFTAMSHGSAVVSLQPTSLASPEVGNPFTLHVNITGGEAIAGYQFSVAFDPEVLRYVAANNADYLPSDAFAMPLPETESVTLVAAAVKGSRLSAGDGTLATLTFEVVARKPFEVELTDVILSDATPAALPVGWRNARVAASPLSVDHTAVLSNYPNPFNPETWIPYQLSEAAEVTLTIYGATGQVIRTLDLGHQPTGVYRSKSRAAYWDGRNDLGERVASGLYFYTLTAGEFTATGKMLIMK